MVKPFPEVVTTVFIRPAPESGKTIIATTREETYATDSLSQLALLVEKDRRRQRSVRRRRGWAALGLLGLGGVAIADGFLRRDILGFIAGVGLVEGGGNTMLMWSLASHYEEIGKLQLEAISNSSRQSNTPLPTQP